MRSFRPEFGDNVAHGTRFWGQCLHNGAAATTAWQQGGKGMGIPARTSAGLFTCTLADAPPGVFLGAPLSCGTDAIANYMFIYSLGYVASTRVFTYTTAVVTA